MPGLRGQADRKQERAAVIVKTASKRAGAKLMMSIQPSATAA